MSTVQFDDEHRMDTNQTSVSLISNGAECIMLSKRFFTEYANENTKRRMRQKVRPYPTEHALQENLQIKVDWDVYKKRLIQNMVSNKT